MIETSSLSVLVLISLTVLVFSASAFSIDGGIPKKDVHFFYYIWYGTPDFDGNWRHWDHEVLPHWQSNVNKNFPSVGTRHSPPEIIHSPYYPLRNPYSSRDPEVIKEQFEDMISAGGTVAVVSWWGQASKSYSTDTQGVCTDLIIDDVLRAADSFGKIKIAFHLEPYPSRSAESVREDVEYIINKYGNHSSIYRSKDGKPLFYVYDSYHIFPSQWRRLLQPDGDITVRGTIYDAWFIGLWLDRNHGRDAKEAGFDGIYTYFATDGFTYGSTTNNWKSMCDYCRSAGMLCILSVGPGYDDTSIRPWNAHNTRDRRDGAYYEEMWQKAIEANPSQVSITSFNEWGEGTQIEAVRKVSDNENFSKKYADYGERGPFKYLHITNRYATMLKSSGQTIHEKQSNHHERSARVAAGLQSDNDDEEGMDNYLISIFESDISDSQLNETAAGSNADAEVTADETPNGYQEADTVLEDAISEENYDSENQSISNVEHLESTVVVGEDTDSVAEDGLHEDNKAEDEDHLDHIPESPVTLGDDTDL